MANFTPKVYNQINTKGTQAGLNTTIVEDGKLRFTTDTGRLYLDTIEDGVSKRTRISDIEDSYTEEQIAEILAPLPKIYLAKDTHRAYVYADGNWYDISSVLLSEIDPDDKNIKYLWMSNSDAEQPEYDSQVYYSTTYEGAYGVTGQFNVPNLHVESEISLSGVKIQQKFDSEGNKIIDFSFN